MARSSSTKLSSTKTCIGSATSEAPRAFSSGWPSESADSGLARYQLNDRDDPSSLPGLLPEVRVLRVDAVSKVPQPLPLGFIFHDFAAERQAAENDVGMLAEVVVPGRVLRPPPQRRDDRHAVAVGAVERGIPTRAPPPL